MNLRPTVACASASTNNRIWLVGKADDADDEDSDYDEGAEQTNQLPEIGF